MQYEVTIDDSGLTKQRNDIITSLDNHIKGEFLCILKFFSGFEFSKSYDIATSHRPVFKAAAVLQT